MGDRQRESAVAPKRGPNFFSFLSFFHVYDVNFFFFFWFTFKLNGLILYIYPYD